MNDNSVAVSIVGDAAGVRPAIEETRGELAGLENIVRDLSANMAKLGAEMREGLGKGAASAHQLAAGMHEARAATEAESGALTRMVMKVHEGAESVRTFQMRAKAFAEVYVAMFAVEGVRRWAESMGEAAEKLRNLSQELGISVADLQMLQGVANQTGVPMDTISKAVGLMDKNLFNSAGRTNLQANAFKSLGISANDGRTNMEKLAVVAEKFKNMDDGPKKAALAFAVFGKSGLAMIPVLERGAAGLEEMNKKTKEYGGVSADAQRKNLALAEATNESKLAFAGFSNVMSSAFAPMLKTATDALNSMIKSFVESYRSGGTAKIIMDAIAGSISALGTALSVAGAILQPFGDLIKAVSNNFGIIAPIAAALAALMAGPYVVAFVSATVATIAQTDAMVALQGAFVLDGLASAAAMAIELFAGGVKAATVATWEFTVALLANPLTWVAIAAAAAAAGLVWLAMHTTSVSNAFRVMKDIALAVFESIRGGINVLAIAITTFADIANDALTMQWGKIRADWNAGMNGIVAEVQAGDNRIKALHDDMMAHLSFGGGFDKSKTTWWGDATTPPPATPGGFNPSLGASKAPKSGGGEKTSIAQKLEEELEAKKTAWAMEQDLQGTFQRYSLQLEADYWAAALKRTDLGAKDKLAVEKKYLAARQALKTEEVSKVVDGFKDELVAAGANSDAKLAVLRREQAFKVKMFGAESAQAREAAKAIVAMEKEKAAQLRELDASIAKGKEEAALAGVDAAEATMQAEVAMGRATNAQMLAAMRTFEAQRYQIRRKAVEDDIRLAMLDPNTSPAKMQELQNRLLQLERQYQATLTKINRQAHAERTAIARGAISQVASGFADHISKMLTLQEGWKTALKGIYQSLVQTAASVLQQIIQKWIEAFLIKLILGKQDAASSVASYIGQAGAGGVASMAAAPFPINLTAPAFGAAMAAAAASFGAVSSAEGGDWNVKEGLYKLHANEMVLPAWAASPLRSMVASGGAPGAPAGQGGGGGGGGKGDTMHLHLHGDVIHNPGQLRRWFETNQKAVGAGVRKYARSNGYSASGR